MGCCGFPGATMPDQRRRGLDAVNLRGGMGAWAAGGLPVDDEHGEPGAVA